MLRPESSSELVWVSRLLFLPQQKKRYERKRRFHVQLNDYESFDKGNMCTSPSCTRTRTPLKFLIEIRGCTCHLKLRNLKKLLQTYEFVFRRMRKLKAANISATTLFTPSTQIETGNVFQGDYRADDPCSLPLLYNITHPIRTHSGTRGLSDCSYM